MRHLSQYETEPHSFMKLVSYIKFLFACISLFGVISLFTNIQIIKNITPLELGTSYTLSILCCTLGFLLSLSELNLESVMYRLSRIFCACFVLSLCLIIVNLFRELTYVGYSYACTAFFFVLWILPTMKHAQLKETRNK